MPTKGSTKFSRTRQYSQIAPFPGAGANVQNAALGGALDAEATPANGALYPEAPRYVRPPAGSAPPGGAVTRPPTQNVTNPTGSSAGASLNPDVDAWLKSQPYGTKDDDILGAAYQKFLGRVADPEGLAAHRGNPEGIHGALATIYDSEEAKNFRTQAPPAAGISGVPSYTGPAPSGWNQTKWDNPQHTSPKYVAGRIMMKYAGPDGRVTDPAKRDAAIKEILAAFPGATYDGTDALYIPSLGPKGIDIWGGASRGEFIPQWIDHNVEAMAGGGASGPGGPTGPAPSPGPLDLSGLSRLNPQDPTFYQSLLAYLMRQLQGQGA